LVVGKGTPAQRLCGTGLSNRLKYDAARFTDDWKLKACEMPPTLALILTLGFIAFLFRRDFREKPNVTGALWLPTLWLFIIASKPVTQWLQVFGLPVHGGASVEEGSPVDALVFAAFLGIGLRVLKKRHVSVSAVISDNKWLALFLLYCFLAIFWSDFSLIALKRWIKVIGHPIMVLVVLTEPDPEGALVRMFKRCAYVLFPVSILWMKYYPELGRKSDEWGVMTNGGVSGGKNELGAMCLIFGLLLIWHLLRLWRAPRTKTRQDELVLICGLLVLVAYCLRKSHSSTSAICVLLGGAIMVGLGLQFLDKKAIGKYAVGGLFVLLIAQLTFDVYGRIVDLSGHSATIEGRGHLWEVLLATDTHPIFGTGFESYWLGERLQNIWAVITWHPTQAHNGYLETYLNLGFVGLCMLIVIILVSVWKCRQNLLTNFEWGRFTLAYLIAIMAHNWTEAGFKGLSVIYFGFFIVALNFPQLSVGRRGLVTETGTEDEQVEAELAYD
jgi:exopolysaccharide production protein ExoQ